jgi:hypothetical protein
MHTRAHGPRRAACARRTRAALPPACARAGRTGEIRPPRLGPGRYLAPAVAPCALLNAWPESQQTGEELLLNGAPGLSPRGAGTAGPTELGSAPTHPAFRTAAPQERRSGSLESPHLPGERTPPHTHSHALHTHGVSGPTPVPGSCGLPRTPRGPHPIHQTLAPGTGAGRPARPDQ